MHNHARSMRQYKLSYRAGACYRRRVLLEAELANKQQRQDAVLELIRSRAIGSQEELKQLLADRGLHVTQATLSRDLRDLGVVRAPTEEGARYVLPEHLVEGGKPHLENL